MPTSSAIEINGPRALEKCVLLIEDDPRFTMGNLSTLKATPSVCEFRYGIALVERRSRCAIVALRPLHVAALFILDQKIHQLAIRNSIGSGIGVIKLKRTRVLLEQRHRMMALGENDEKCVDRKSPLH